MKINEKLLVPGLSFLAIVIVRGMKLTPRNEYKNKYSTKRANKSINKLKFPSRVIK